MFERFTDRARRVLVLAQEEARLLNHNFMGTEHLLLGLIHEEEGVAAHALRLAGVSYEASQREILAILGGGILPSTGGSPPFTPRSKKVLEYSLREALQLGHSYIGTEHILLGLLREGEGVACRVLVSQGTDLNRVRQEVLALMGGGARHPENDPRTMESIEPGLEVRRRSEELLRAEIESALTTGPGAQLLRRYAAGELSSAELSDQSLVRVLAESMLELQQIVRRLAGQIFPNPP